MICVIKANLSSNFGDVAITVGLVRLLRKVTDQPIALLVDPNARTEHIQDLPDGVSLVTEPPAGAARVYGGGEHLFSGSHLSEWMRLLDGAVITPGTFGPFDTIDGFDRLGPVAAREPLSARLMTELLGYEVPVLADPAMFIDERPGQPSGRIIYAPRPDKVGIRVGRYNRLGDPTEWEAFHRFVELIDPNTEGLIVAHSARDVPLCRALSRETGIRWYRPRRLHGLVNIYRTASKVVAARFHALIFAYSFGVPFEAVWWPEHGPKIPGLLELDTPVDELRAATVEWFRVVLV